MKAYRDRVDVGQIVKDASAIDVSPAERLARAVPFQGTFYSGLPLRNYLPYGRELLDDGLESAAVIAFERAAQANPGASTLYRLGTLLARSGETVPGSRRVRARARLATGSGRGEQRSRSAAGQSGNLDEAIGRFRAALASTPEYPDALNNLGYALLLTGRDEEARALYEKALALQPDFPEVLNNLGLLYGRAGDMDRAERYFRDALGRRAGLRRGRQQSRARVRLERAVGHGGRPSARRSEADTGVQAAYVTLAKIHFSAGRSKEGIAVLEQLLQRNPKHAVAVELLRQWKGL